MTLPYVIDNQTHRLADVLNDLLATHEDRTLDVATAYFTIGGFAAWYNLTCLKESA